VDDDAGRVENAAQSGLRGGGQLSDRPLGEVAGIVAGANVLARLREGRPGGLDGERAGDMTQRLAPGELVDRGQIAKLHEEESRRLRREQAGARSGVRFPAA
jgi:hypothetical protein